MLRLEEVDNKLVGFVYEIIGMRLKYHVITKDGKPLGINKNLEGLDYWILTNAELKEINNNIKRSTAMAKAKADVKKKDAPSTAKKSVSSVPKDEIEKIKAEFRERLNRKELKDLEKLAKSKDFGIDVKKYKHLSGGLYKMNIVNSCLGVATRMIKAGSSKTAVTKLLK